MQALRSTTSTAKSSDTITYAAEGTSTSLGWGGTCLAVKSLITGECLTGNFETWRG
jgi:hypothetical protein